MRPWRRPGIHNPQSWLWIPGSFASLTPRNAASNNLEIFALVPVRYVGLEDFECGGLDMDVVVDKSRAERVAEERIVVQRGYRLAQCFRQQRGLCLIRRVRRR